jgi:dethiobiotin synthase
MTGFDPHQLPSPLWVLGTGTGVGKTHVAARIARAWAERGPVEYRKPIQTGVASAEDPEADAPAVRGPGISVATGVLLRAPLSPLAAGELEGRPVDLDALAAWTTQPPAPGARLLLEAAGGVMVPLAPGRHWLAWASGFKIPCVVVAAGGLGTLNHSLLTCEALMIRGWTIEALLLNPGVDDSFQAAAGNAAILARCLPFPVHILD